MSWYNLPYSAPLLPPLPFFSSISILFSPFPNVIVGKKCKYRHSLRCRVRVRCGSRMPLRLPPPPRRPVKRAEVARGEGLAMINPPLINQPTIPRMIHSGILPVLSMHIKLTSQVIPHSKSSNPVPVTPMKKKNESWWRIETARPKVVVVHLRRSRFWSQSRY
ncbi:hypothetical protein IF1G_10909 [Cordyceps javanica]|uniref:Uncharacterized protein n=1 Tax=Cordyceps javanica TaxID=43265 RepID=A0A545ULU8_9HYPO|nr:hypothetical protein IF1G_10909 [Cordyceps javanica]